MPLQLIHALAPPDLARFAAELPEAVASGDIVGLGVIVVARGRRFWVDCFGQMARMPWEYVGLVGELEHCLREMGRARKDTNTTL